MNPAGVMPVPVIAMGVTPVGDKGEVIIVKAELPEISIHDGLKNGMAPNGRPVAFNITNPLNPPVGVIVTV